MAAALVLGLVLGQALPRGEGAFAMQDGTLIARGATAKALDAQLASAPGREGAVRILLSFRRTDGGYCRAFETAAQAAIACRRGGAWQVEALRAAGPAASTTEYRQASSETGALMADAQEMMAGEPLDAEDERAAIRAGWAAAPGR